MDAAEQAQENRRALIQLYSVYTVETAVGAATLGVSILALLSNAVDVWVPLKLGIITFLFVPMVSIFLSAVFFGAAVGKIVSLPIPTGMLSAEDSLTALRQYYDDAAYELLISNNKHIGSWIKEKNRTLPIVRAMKWGVLVGTLALVCSAAALVLV